MTSEVVTGEHKSWAETPPRNPPLRHLVSEFVERQTWLDKLASPIQNSLLAFFGQPGQPGRKLKDILSGTWLGHALHPTIDQRRFVNPDEAFAGELVGERSDRVPDQI